MIEQSMRQGGCSQAGQHQREAQSVTLSFGRPEHVAFGWQFDEGVVCEGK
jgi:hypothetical protein